MHACMHTFYTHNMCKHTHTHTFQELCVPLRESSMYLQLDPQLKYYRRAVLTLLNTLKVEQRDDIVQVMDSVHTSVL